MPTWLTVLVSLWIGACVGVLTMAMMFVAKDADRRMGGDP